MRYRVTATFEVEAPEDYRRTVGKLVHGLVQETVGEYANAADGEVVVIGASAGDGEPIESDADPCKTCRHPYSAHRGGEDCNRCACTWFDTIGEGH